MSQDVINVLDALGEKFGIVVDWTAQNIQPYLQDLMGRCVSCTFYTSIIGILLGITLVSILAVHILLMVFKFSKMSWWWDWWDCPEKHSTDISLEALVCICLLFITCFAAFYGVSLIFDNIASLISCKVLPEKIFIDMLTGIAAEV